MSMLFLLYLGGFSDRHVLRMSTLVRVISDEISAYWLLLFKHFFLKNNPTMTNTKTGRPFITKYVKMSLIFIISPSITNRLFLINVITKY